MRTIAILLFASGILLAVRVMFFGVRENVGLDEYRTRAFPLSLAAFLFASGIATYLLLWNTAGVETMRVGAVLIVGALAAVAAWWTVKRSEASIIASPDPEDDPRYRFQGHIAKVVASLGEVGSDVSGKIAFVIDDRTLELTAKWLPGTTASAQDGDVSSEVVIERIDGDLAFVEPWGLVEGRI
jgi:hypothetical protein